MEEYNIRDIDAFQTDYYKQGKYDLVAQAPHLAKLAAYYEKKYEHTKDWIDCVKAHGLYNSALVRQPSCLTWKMKLFQLQQAYWKKSSTASYEQQRFITETLKSKLESIRNVCKSLISQEDLINMVSSYTEDNTETNPTLDQMFFTYMKSISLHCTEMMSDFAGSIIAESLSLLSEKAPCDFEAVAIGSLARGEATPYSDLEYLFLIHEETPDAMAFFETLAVTSYFVIGNLGETDLSHMAIKELQGWFDDQTKSGFKIDGLSAKAGNIPTGNGLKKSNFIATSLRLATTYRDVLMNPTEEACIGDLTAMLTYTKSLYAHRMYHPAINMLDEFQAQIKSMKPSKERVDANTEMFFKDERKHNKLTDLLCGPSKFNIDVKKDLFRYPSIQILDSSIITRLIGRSSWDVPDILMLIEKGTKPFCEVYKFLLASSTYVRLAAYLYYDSQDDRATVAKIHNYPLVPPRNETDLNGTRWHVPSGLLANIYKKKHLLHGMSAREAVSAESALFYELITLHLMGKASQVLRILEKTCGDVLYIDPVAAASGMNTKHQISGLDNMRCVAILLENCGKYKEVLKIFEHINSNIKHDTRFEMAKCYMKLGSIKKAVEVLKTIRRKSSLVYIALGKAVILDSFNHNTNDHDSLRAKIAAAEDYFSKALQQKLKDNSRKIQRSLQQSFDKRFAAASPEERLHMITDETPETMGILNVLGMTYMQYDDTLGYKLAELHLLKAYEIGVNLYGRQSAIPSVASILSSLGDNYCSGGQYDNAIKHLEPAVAMLRMLSESNSSLMTHNMTLLGDSFSNLGQYKSGAKNYYRALSRCRKQGLQSKTTDIYRELCRLYSCAKHAYKSIEFGCRNLKCLRAETPERDIEIAWILGFLGMSHMFIGQYSLGRSYLTEEHTIYERVNSKDVSILELENGARYVLSLPLGPTTMVNGMVIPGYTSMMVNCGQKLFLKNVYSKIKPRLENPQMWQYLSDR